MLRRLPLQWLLELGRLLGIIWYYLVPIRVRVAKSNARQVFSGRKTEREICGLVRDACIFQSINALECLAIMNLCDDAAHSRFTLHGVETYRNALARGRGVCVTSLHLGNFEQSIALIAAQGFTLNIIYRRLGWGALHDYWNLVRESFGIQAISHRKSRDEIRAALQRGESVGFACDQHMPAHRGILTRFLGQLAATTPAPTRFAHENGSAIIVAYTYRDPNNPLRHHIHFEDFELQTEGLSHNDMLQLNTQRLNDRLSELILEHPEQWLWHHRRFKVTDRLSEYTIPESLKEDARLLEQAQHDRSSG